MAMDNAALPESWFAEVSRLAPPFADDKSARAFSSAVESAVRTTDLRAVRLLFRCLSDADHSGVQTTLFRILGSVKAEDYYAVLLDEMPALVRAAPKSAAQALDYTGYRIENAKISEIATLMNRKLDGSTLATILQTMEETGMDEDDAVLEAFYEALKSPKV
jgi:hypothetical protein